MNNKNLYFPLHAESELCSQSWWWKTFHDSKLFINNVHFRDFSFFIPLFLSLWKPTDKVIDWWSHSNWNSRKKILCFSKKNIHKLCEMHILDSIRKFCNIVIRKILTKLNESICLEIITITTFSKLFFKIKIFFFLMQFNPLYVRNNFPWIFLEFEL